MFFSIYKYFFIPKRLFDDTCLNILLLNIVNYRMDKKQWNHNSIRLFFSVIFIKLI